jgi:glycosyltransferase involved in cell wall biosynthesis
MSNAPQMTRYAIGVVIPTYNRADMLITCLQHLEQQTAANFEVIVVDDGSTDSTSQKVEQFAQRTSLNLRYILQKNSGPACARNRAISMLNAPFCLMIGDDIFAMPDFVENHLKVHREHQEIHVAVLGWTRWSKTGQKVTKFMNWLDASGNQFAYRDLLEGVPPDWKHFYTSNLSVKTELLKRFPFDESFPNAAMEDMELAFRITRTLGLKLIFLPTAIAFHLHPTDFRRACRRMLTIGLSAKHMHDLWPESKPEPSGTLKSWIFGIVLRHRWFIKPLVNISDVLIRVWCPNPFMKIALKVHYLIGYSAPT